MASLVTSHKRSYDSSSDKENPSPTPTMWKKQKSAYDLVPRHNNRSHVHSMLQAQARHVERDVLTPPPSSEIDIDVVQRRTGPVPSSQPRSSALSSSPRIPSSSTSLPTEPIRGDDQEHAKRPISYGTLDIGYDGSYNLVLGRSRKSAATSSKKLLVSPHHLPKHLQSSDKETRLVPLPRKAQHTSRNHVLLLVDQRGYLMVHVLGQNGCRLQVLGARMSDVSPSLSQDDAAGLGKRYTVGRVVTVRPPDVSTMEGQGDLVVDVEIDMYSCRSVVHWVIPTAPKPAEADDADMQDEEELSDVDEGRSRSFTPEAPLGQSMQHPSQRNEDVVAPLSPPTSSPRRLSPIELDFNDSNAGEKMDEDIFRDLPPSSPPLEMDDLPTFGANDDDDATEDEMEARQVVAADEAVSRPLTPLPAVPTPTTMKPIMPVKSRDFATIHKPSAFGLSDRGMFGFPTGGPSRKPQVTLTKVMVKAPIAAPVARSREATPRVEVERVKSVKSKARFSEGKETGVRVSFAAEPEKVVVQKVDVPAPTPQPQVQVQPTTLEMESIPETIMPAAFVPSPIPAEATTISEPIMAEIVPAAIDPPSSPARSIYSQMTSSSEDESDSPRLGQVEKRIMIERLRATASPANGIPTSTPGASGSGSAVSKGVKREIMDDAERKEKKTRRKVVDKEGKVKAVKKKATEGKTSDSKLESISTASATTTPVTSAGQPAVPATASNFPADFDTSATTTDSASPPDLDLTALTATSVVFSGVSAISALDLVKTILDSQPSMRSIGTDVQWAEWIGDTLRSSEMFGRVDRKGKDSSGHPLLPLYYYVPSSDPDLVRAKELGGCMRPLRGVQRGGGKAIDWRPVGSRGRRS